ncbi:MAG: FHA domain-containing protein [Acaryochloris sp. RU_4_1]|nr:FHA domain-containing protein [Acaryochloris sp. SU_5_25]NJM66163.1 FHA domain-containing protein [Acaryochloris sp. RU_4_1]NJR56296.1 FHA domain-containing protein [Acaryochloris sp. CRU_2_0]
MPAGATQIQLAVARLLHERTNTIVDLPTNLNLVHIGKPNDRIPPDIDVSGFPDSDVVSRVHADIRIDPDGYYLEDTGSANGTYVNSQPLRPGDRYRLRAGDRIALGKEDKVSFIFQPG